MRKQWHKRLFLSRLKKKKKIRPSFKKFPSSSQEFLFPSVILCLCSLAVYLHRTLPSGYSNKELLRGSGEAPLERQEVENFMIPHQTPEPYSFLRRYLHPTCFLGPSRPYLLSLVQPTIKRVSLAFVHQSPEKRPGPTIPHNIPALSRN